MAGLFVFRDPVIIHSAHQFRTARKSFRDLEKMVRNTPDLYKQVLGYHGQDAWDDIKGIRVNGAEMSIELAPVKGELGGPKIEYQARSNGSGRGFTGDLIVLDEAYDLSMDEIAAMMPTMAARSMDGNPQIWYTSSAGMPNSYVLNDLRDRGIAGTSPKLAYYEWSAPKDADTGDVDAWYQANPGMGVRISEDYVRETEYESMGDEQFRRERMGILAPIGGDSAISESAWARCLDHESVASDSVVFAVDVPPARDVATIAAVSVRPDGVRHVEVVDRRAGVSWVPSRLRELRDRWKPVAVVLDEGSAAGTLVPDLRREGVRTVPLSMRDYGQACAEVFDAVQQHRLAHTGQAELDAAVLAARSKGVGESLWKWDRKTQVADISPLVAVTHAWYGVTLKTKKRSAGGKPGGGWKVVGLG